jgi:FMN phosphatase YigB (HAD superfamily)
MKSILFVDFDGTICFDKYWRSLPKEKRDQIDIFLFGQDKTILNDWMRGKYTSEEINKILAEKLQIPYHKLWELFVNDCKTMRVSQEIINNLNHLKNKYIIILVTGNMDSFSRFTVPSLYLDKVFDHINNSFIEGKLKHENKGEIFVKYADKFNIPIQSCYLIDDSDKACKSFKDLGGTALQISPENDVFYYLRKLSLSQ